MKMNRRNALLGIGAIATGGGAVFGSGAFSQVTADRTVNLGVSNDSKALLGLSQGTGATGIIGTTEADAGGSNTNEVIQFNATNLNADAETKWTAAMEITNNGDSSVDVSISNASNGSTGSGGVLQFQYGSSPSYLTDSAKTLTTNETVTIDIVVDLTTDSKSESGIPSDVTFKAQ